MNVCESVGLIYILINYTTKGEGDTQQRVRVTKYILKYLKFVPGATLHAVSEASRRNHDSSLKYQSIITHILSIKQDNYQI